MRNAAPLQVESNAVRAEKIRKVAVHDECQQSLVTGESSGIANQPRRPSSKPHAPLIKYPNGACAASGQKALLSL